MQQLQGKSVTVVYRKMTYQGMLVNVGKEDVTLETLSGRVVLPMPEITSIRPLSEQRNP